MTQQEDSFRMLLLCSCITAEPACIAIAARSELVSLPSRTSGKTGRREAAAGAQGGGAVLRHRLASSFLPPLTVWQQSYRAAAARQPHLHIVCRATMLLRAAPIAAAQRVPRGASVRHARVPAAPHVKHATTSCLRKASSFAGFRSSRRIGGRAGSLRVSATQTGGGKSEDLLLVEDTIRLTGERDRSGQ